MNDLGCHGGEAYSAFEFMHYNNVTDETCSIYQARGHDNGIDCAPITKCKNCNPHEPCFVPDEYYVYSVDEFGQVSGEENMMQEIYQRGPIACGIAVPESLENYKGGIYKDETGDMNIVHDISVVGYGVEDGTKYWVVRNSWGTHWGESGFLRVVRGINNIAIESDCSWATPVDTWSDDVKYRPTKEEKEHPGNDKYRENSPYPEGFSEEFLSKKNGGCRRVPKAAFENGEVKTREMSWETINTAELPKNWDWRSVNKTNYLGWTKNQHIPVYCGSCWAQGTTSALGDRFNILLKDHNPTPIDLSAQVMVNCRAGGSCNGGNPIGVYDYAYYNGIPDTSCEQYVAVNLDKDTCGPMDICKDCTPPIPSEGETLQENCRPVEYKKYFVSDYYSVYGADRMKAELYKYGPISCGVMVTDNFENYKGGIYSEDAGWIMINHEIAVVGWGYDEASQTEYWVGRNSWGTYWGEMGFFRIEMHKNNLGIETDCSAGIPTFEKASLVSEILQ